MTHAKRYSAEEFESMARTIFREAGASEPLGEALFQASETEDKVTELVEAIKSARALASDSTLHPETALSAINATLKIAILKFKGEA